MACGTNTDGEGFIASLRQLHPDVSLQGTTATVIGAGGAAKAIIGALIDEGVTRIGIINRTRERILGLQEQFGSQIIEINETAAEQALAWGLVTMNAMVELLPPPGAGLATVTGRLPATATRAAGTVAVSTFAVTD